MMSMSELIKIKVIKEVHISIVFALRIAVKILLVILVVEVLETPKTQKIGTEKPDRFSR